MVDELLHGTGRFFVFDCLISTQPGILLGFSPPIVVVELEDVSDSVVVDVELVG